MNNCSDFICINTIFLFFLMAFMTSANAQETIKEEQMLLSGYVDTSGKVLLTGYATSGSLSYMPFLKGTNYTFDNHTNQLYAVTDNLTSKNEDAWSLNFSLDGYYSDYSATFYLPAGAEVTKFEMQPELNYQFQVKEDSLALSVQGNKVISPWIKVDYKTAGLCSVKRSYGFFTSCIADHHSDRRVSFRVLSRKAEKNRGILCQGNKT